MAITHLVVDGSNIATEGRTYPSLAQLESAVAELKSEHPEAGITVVVDATFAHRIDPSELARFEEALARSEYINPPAGAIGRGDAFVLRIAEKVGATVVSNDSFQEFHGDHGWLFDPDRLLGASPVPGVGWIFMARTPVRGAKSRAATRSVRSLPPLPKPKMPPPGRTKRVAPADEEPEEVEAAAASSGKRRSRRVATSMAAVNDPATFFSFIASHPLGDIIQAEVESFTSHGAVIRFDGVHCYAPLSGLGDPPPRSPREVLTRGEVRPFLIRGLDPERRGVELAIPVDELGAARPDASSDEVSTNHDGTEGGRRRRARRGRGQRPEPAPIVPPGDLGETASQSYEEPGPETSQKAAGKKAAAKKRVPKKAAPEVAPSKKAPAKKRAPKKAAPEVVPREVPSPEVVPPAKKAPAKKRAPKKAALETAVVSSAGSKGVAKKAPAKKRAPKKTAAGVEVAPQPAKKGARKKVVAKERPAKLRPEKRRTAKQAAPVRASESSAEKNTTPAKRGRRNSAGRKTEEA